MDTQEIKKLIELMTDIKSDWSQCNHMNRTL